VDTDCTGYSFLYSSFHLNIFKIHVFPPQIIIVICDEQILRYSCYNF
jgi:hypothetical protein